MVENLLLKYMKERLEKDVKIKDVSEAGPVITISRETGCAAEYLAQSLTETINLVLKSKNEEEVWRYITKENISKAVTDLTKNPIKTEKILNDEDSGILEEFVEFFSTKYYPSDNRIKNKYAEVIRSFANNGNVIIVGRASEAIAQNIEKSLHIKLHAPEAWRAKHIADKTGKSIDNAKKYISEIDHKRQHFRSYFHAHNRDSDFYDLTFNCKTIPCEEMVELIIKIMENRNLI